MGKEDQAVLTARVQEKTPSGFKLFAERGAGKKVNSVYMSTSKKDRVKTRRVRVSIANLSPVDGRTSEKAYSNAWKVAETLFNEREYLGFKVTLVATDILQFFDLLARSKRIQKPFEVRLTHRRSKKLAPLGGEIVVTFRGVDFANPWSDTVERFLENLYLAMNLSVPGSCNLYRASFEDKYDQVGRVWWQPKPEVWLSLSAEGLEFAYQSALEHGWPRFQRIELVKAWEWLDQIGALALDVAREPSHRSVCTLLRLGLPQSHDPDGIRLCIQAIEALLGQGAPARVVQRRVEAMLGTPRSYKNWYTNLYSIRSQIVHGAAPLLRPGAWLNDEEAGGVIKKYFEQTDKAYAVLLALIQRLVLNNAHKFQVSETIALC